jgi:predicted anti-sigma-YlaC factor YlaD
VLTYLRAVGFLCPGLFVWLFNHNFLLPKLQSLWAHTDLPGSSAQWILDYAVFLTRHLTDVISALVVLCLALELFWRQWPRYRGGAVAAFTVFVNAITLVGVTAISTAIMVALPVLSKTK